MNIKYNIYLTQTHSFDNTLYSCNAKVNAEDLDINEAHRVLNGTYTFAFNACLLKEKCSAIYEIREVQ